MSLHMVDVKDYPAQVAATARRARWYTAGALTALVIAYGLAGASDYADALRIEAMQAEAQRQVAAGKVEHWREGFKSGQASVSCWAGFKVDSRTGEPLQ